MKETFGAVLARVQATRAAEPSIRALMDRIAADELGHASLSWRIAAWLEETQLDAAARARVAAARRRALDELDAELAGAGPGLVALGIPEASWLRVALAHVRPAVEDGLAD